VEPATAGTGAWCRIVILAIDGRAGRQRGSWLREWGVLLCSAPWRAGRCTAAYGEISYAVVGPVSGAF
jgi:hypothetical protein